MRRNVTSRFVVAVSLVLIAVCVGWALLVQRVVPSACTYPDPPDNAQYVHCP